MKHLKLFCIIAVICVISNNLNKSYAFNLSTVEILGKKFYVYEAKKGDTFFGIAREFNWNDNELERMNPDVITPLKKGAKIYYPVDDSESETIATEAIRNVKPTDLTHVVKKGETVYSIAHLYGLPIETIYKLNPSSRNGIKANETLILNEAAPTYAQLDSENATDESYFYTIKRGDTLRSIASSNGVSVASILQANPGLSRFNFKTGDTIKIPETGSGIEIITTTVEEPQVQNFSSYSVKSDETWSSIARKHNLEVKDLKYANPDIDKLKKNQTISIPKIVNIEVEETVVGEDPRELSNDGIDEIYNDIHGLSDKENNKYINIAIIPETSNGRKDLEFIRGFLTGIKELKNDSYKINLKIIDGSLKSTKILNELEEFKPSLIFITADKNIPEHISAFASENQTPVVNTFDVRSEEYTVNPYFIQLLTPPSYFNEIVADNIYNKFNDHKIIMMGPEDNTDLLASSLKKLFKPSEILILSLETTEGSKIPDFSKMGKILFYGYPTKKEEVEKILEYVQEVKDQNPFIEIKVLGRPNWIVYDESLGEKLHNINAIIPSRFYIDEKSGKAQNFYASYKELFDRTPVKSVPLYAGVGYDTATYFLPALYKANLDLNNLIPSSDSLQNEFDLKRVSNWGGFINEPIYLVHFSPSGMINKIVIE